MKAHLATLPLPPKPRPLSPSPSHSSSFSFSSSDQDEPHPDSDDKPLSLSYGLRENPKKSFRLADPEFSFAVDAGSVVQDRESETESKNPTRRRSNRTRKSTVGLPKTTITESPTTEPEPLSSVSDTCSDEDVAMCLMMLSRDKWMTNVEEIKLKRKQKHHHSDNLKKTTRSSRALPTHTTTTTATTICFPDEAVAKISGTNNDRIFECPFCYKVFGSGQALGGHKRSHLLPSSSSTAIHPVKSFIDLNLPAPTEEDEISVVSDA